ncbi:DUF6356 family protein [Phenylobacterium sp.]|uniref:DUF6356 family protein n=1 Tax=Phenylobacterium sp. TaxID=1871053 RepID=UPI002FC8B8DA
MLDAFNRHPSAVGETYVEHLGHAGGFGAEMVAAGLACLIHAVFPFWFERTASLCIQRLHAQMVARRRITPQDDARGQVETWSYSI